MVCRGTFSEGYNFSDEMARGIIIIGIPLLPSNNIMFIFHGLYLFIFVELRWRNAISLMILNIRDGITVKQFI